MRATWHIAHDIVTYEASLNPHIDIIIVHAAYTLRQLNDDGMNENVDIHKLYAIGWL